jgi:cell wall-associated NlpC family hydrolase
MREFDKYVGWVPTDGARIENCWTFLARVLHDEFQITVPVYTDQDSYLKTLAEQTISGSWRLVESPQLGDIVLMTLRGATKHVAVFIGDNKILHYCNDRIGVTVERLSSWLWKGRVDGFYRHESR